MLIPSTFEGKIVDLDSNPIENVNVYTYSSGTATNENGYFKITAKESDVIYISHIQHKKIAYIASTIPKVITLHYSFINTNQIIVNSTLNKKSLGDFSKSVTIIDPKTNESQIDLSDFANSIPNVNMISGTSKGRYFRIRGVGELSQFAGEGPPVFSVGYYLDDMDLSGIDLVRPNTLEYIGLVFAYFPIPFINSIYSICFT